MSKSFENLQISLKGDFLEIVGMQKLHYPTPKRSIPEESPSSKTFLGSTGHHTPRNPFEFEYHRKFETEFEKNVGYESGVHMRSILEKNKRPKTSYWRKIQWLKPLSTPVSCPWA
jgi:hypothetical protein